MIQISVILGLCLVLSLGGFKMYYDKAEAEKKQLEASLNQAISNQKVLESTISEQNREIEESLRREQQAFERIDSLEEENRTALAEVSDIREKFARHNMSNLSLQKPGLIERIINKGTAKVNEDIRNITDPNQLDRVLVEPAANP